MPVDTVYVDRFSRLTHVTAPVPDVDVLRGLCCEALGIVYNIAGCKTVLVEGSTYQLLPGELLILNYAETFYINTDENDISDYYIILFSQHLFRHIDQENTFLRKFISRELGEANALHFTDEQNALVLGSLRQVAQMQSRADTRISFLAALMLFISEINLSVSYRAAIESIDARRILQYMNADLSQDLSTHALAQHFFMSESKFSRYFKSITGMSPKTYVSRKRINRARELLRHNVRIDDVMAECGFRDYSTFYKTHAKYYSYPPSENYARGEDDPFCLNGFPPMQEFKE